MKLIGWKPHKLGDYVIRVEERHWFKKRVIEYVGSCTVWIRRDTGHMMAGGGLYAWWFRIKDGQLDKYRLKDGD